MFYVVRMRNDAFRETAVRRVAGVLLAVAQALPAAQAVPAVTAGGAEPPNADPSQFLDVGDAGARRGDMPDPHGAE